MDKREKRKGVTFINFFYPASKDWISYRFSTTAVDSMEGKYDSSLSTTELVSEVMWKAIADTFGASSVILSDAVVFTGKADKGDYQVWSPTEHPFFK